jgi:hypothetical protein
MLKMMKSLFLNGIKNRKTPFAADFQRDSNEHIVKGIGRGLNL